MKKRRIFSPMAWGNGAYILHKMIEKHIPNYTVKGYNPYLTIIPFSLPWAAPVKGADLIHTTPDYAAFFHKPSQPMVLTFHNYVLDRWMQNHSSWIQSLYYTTTLKLLSRMALKKAHALTSVSHYTARLVQEDLTTSEHIRVIYNGIDVDQFKPAASSPYSRKEVRVFFSGNLIRRKGAHWLPSIARGLGKNIRIYYTQGLRTQNNLAPNSKLQPLGPVPFKDMPNRYLQMDLLVMPSVREGFGLAVAEAMSCGLPVVATNGSAIPELIDEGKGGFLCPVGDVYAFAEKINLLADSPKLRHEMGEYNRAKVEKMFTLDRMVKEYQDLFQEVLG
jgi:L-malate glycosyltransferase